MLETAVAELETGADDGWIEALPARVYTTPQYGEIPVTVDKLERFIDNFKNNVRGQEIATDFEHGRDPAKGLGASGWYKEFDIRPSSDDPNQVSLWAKVAFTDEAKKEIQEGKWKYWSLEWDDEYSTDDGRVISDVVIGGGLTNRPIAKRTMPINFSETMWEELDDDTRREFAVWSTAFVNTLPDSSFLYVEPGGKKDSEGKTTPRSKRHLPYKDKSGKIDLPHLRNAIARIPQMKGISAELKARLQAKARRLLGGKSKSLAEGTEVDEAFELLISHNFDLVPPEVTDEHKEEEHAEPGTGNPPEPRKFESGEDDPAIKGGWRRDPLPVPLSDPSIEGTNPKPPNHNASTEGGETVEGITLTPAQVSQLYSLLGITMPETPGDEFFEPAKVAFSEWKTLRDATNAVSEEKEFAEKYPNYWREHVEMMQRDRDNAAKQFSEQVSTVKIPEGDKTVPTKQGLSAQAADKLREIHIKFSEGKATVADFEEAVKTIMDGGLVQYGEVGSSATKEATEINTSTLRGLQAARQQFAELVVQVQKENPEMDYSKALTEAAQRNPELASAYRATQAA